MKHKAVSRPCTLRVQGVQGIFEKNLSQAPFSFGVCVCVRARALAVHVHECAHACVFTCTWYFDSVLHFPLTTVNLVMILWLEITDL